MCWMVVCRCSFLDKWSCILWRMAVCLFPIPSLRMAYSNFYCMLHWLRFGFILLRCNRVSSIAPGFILLASLVVRVGSSICDVKGSANGRKSLTKFYYSENELGSNLKAAGEKDCLLQNTFRIRFPLWSCMSRKWEVLYMGVEYKVVTHVEENFWENSTWQKTLSWALISNLQLRLQSCLPPCSCWYNEQGVAYMHIVLNAVP